VFSATTWPTRRSRVRQHVGLPSRYRLPPTSHSAYLQRHPRKREKAIWPPAIAASFSNEFISEEDPDKDAHKQDACQILPATHLTIGSSCAAPFTAGDQ